MPGDSFIGTIEPFTVGDDYIDYFERMDCILETNKIEDEGKQSKFVFGVCGPDLYKIIKACVAPQKPKDVKYSELKRELKKYFEPSVNVIAERYRFHSRQQQPDESISDYIMEIKALSRDCKFEAFLPEALRDKLVFGVASDKTKAKLLSENTFTFDNACSIARAIEATQQGLDFMHTQRKHGECLFRKKPARTTTKQAAQRAFRPIHL